MTIETWEKEFLPTPAKKHQARSKRARTPERILAAARHSLAKWLGTRKKSLEKHGLTLNELFNENLLSSDDCALCQVTGLTSGVEDYCLPVCPLARVRLKSGERDDCGAGNSYGQAMDGKPAKLIRELKRAVKLAEADVEAGKKKRR